jgi:hypothetical protein
MEPLPVAPDPELVALDLDDAETFVRLSRPTVNVQSQTNVIRKPRRPIDEQLDLHSALQRTIIFKDNLPAGDADRTATTSFQNYPPRKQLIG